MKISYNWLKEYVEINLSPAELAHRLTMLGLEIEGIEETKDDAVLEISITPNRGDCLSLIGIAREAAMLNNVEVKFPKASSLVLKTNPSKSGDWEVEITDPSLCPRYAAALIKGVKIAPSPDWLAKRLISAGIRPLNNVVDVTNYILMEWGQPMHAFDLKFLEGNKIIVRRAEEGEKFTTLDDKEYTLNNQMLVISDAKKAVALAGVMGGKNSEVSDMTHDILLECACFNPVAVRFSARKLGIATESSYRFERGIDGGNLLLPLKHAVELIKELAGGEVTEPVIDNYPKELPVVEIFLRFEMVNKILGTVLKSDEIINLIKRMFFAVIKEEKDGILVLVPGFRREIEREIDLIEEIARLYGYENIPTTIPCGEIPHELSKSSQSTENIIRGYLTGCGIWEAINFSFTSENICSKLKNEVPVLKLSNPLVQEEGALRTSLLGGLLKNISYNLNRQISDIKLFEIGHTFRPYSKDRQPEEKNYLAIALTGKKNPLSWYQPAENIDFFDLKGLIEGLLERLGFSDWRWERANAPYLHAGQSIELLIDGEKTGLGGQLIPSMQKDFDLQQRVFVWEMDLTSLMSKIPKQGKVVSLPRYPAVFRDLAVVVDQSVTAGQIRGIIESCAGKYLKELKLFDVYWGNQIEQGKKSLAYALTYQSEEGTLSDEVVNSLQDKILRALGEELGASLRIS